MGKRGLNLGERAHHNIWLSLYTLKVSSCSDNTFYINYALIKLFDIILFDISYNKLTV